MNDYIEYAEKECPMCGKGMVWQECDAMGCDDGYIHMYEYDDPLWYDPGDFEPCQECNGLGHVTWCQNCGYCENDHQQPAESFHVDLPGFLE